MEKKDVLDEDTKRTKGTDALSSNIEAAKAVSEIVKTTLGPMGMDKMLIDSVGDSVITNDGVKILEEMDIQHPGAKLLVEVAKTQEQEVGDGTTSAVILSGELLERAQELLRLNIHPTTIIRNFKLASEKGLEILDKYSHTISENDKKILHKISETAMTGKVVEYSKSHLSKLLVEATLQVREKNELNKKRIKIQKAVGGESKESFIVNGIVLDKNPANINMPKRLENAQILLLDEALEVRELDSEAKVNLSSLSEYEEFLEAEKKYLVSLVEKIKHSGANVVICQKGIDDAVAYHLAKENILAIRRTKKSDIELLSSALGKKIINNIEDIKNENLGNAKAINVKNLLNENFIFIEGCENPKALTLFLKGSTNHLLDEIERAIEDALGDLASVMKTKKIVPGGGAIETSLYTDLHAYSKTLSGREELIVKAFAESFLSIPKVLCKNAGLDEIDTMSSLITFHENKNNAAGLNGHLGIEKDVYSKGIVEPKSIKLQAIKSATESSTMILKIDDIIAAKYSDSTKQE